MTATPGRVSGWYDDEADAAVLRYWDGTGWTPHTAARPMATTVSARTPAPASATGSALFATVRLPVDEPAHPTVTTLTTVPTPPERPARQPAESAASAAASARPVAPLTVLGAAVAAAAFVLASAALAVAVVR